MNDGFTDLLLTIGPELLRRFRRHMFRGLEGINVDQEYELIKQKKSKLSANQRRLVAAKKECDR